METMYVITNGKQYLKANNKLTSQINQAKKYPNVKLARNQIINMKRTFKKMGIWEVISYSEQQQEQNKVKTKIQAQQSDKSIIISDNFINNHNELINYKIQLENNILNAEKEQQDLLHYAEFYVLNACEGYYFYKMLQDVRVKRRYWKNELERVTILLANPFSTEIHNKKTKSYQPRIRQDLFKDKDRKKHTEYTDGGNND